MGFADQDRIEVIVRLRLVVSGKIHKVFLQVNRMEDLCVVINLAIHVAEWVMGRNRLALVVFALDKAMASCVDNAECFGFSSFRMDRGCPNFCVQGSLNLHRIRESSLSIFLCAFRKCGVLNFSLK